MDIASITIENWLTNEAEHLKQLLDPTIYAQVPLIDVNDAQNCADGALVRFKGMVQDMYGSEVYLETYHFTNNTTGERVTKSGKYRDTIPCLGLSECIDEFSPKGDRHCYVVVSVPGLNSWVRQHYTIKEPLSESCSRGLKRGIDDVMDVDEDSGKKKATVEPEQKVLHETTANSSLHLKTQACQVKVYENSDSIKLNEVFEFVGFLTFQDDNTLEEQTHPQSSPCLHIVHFTPLHHLNPYIDSSVTSISLPAIKKELQILFTQLLLGDTLSAEYLICNLLSEIYTRRDCLPLGKLCLNFSKVPKMDLDYVQELYNILKELLPKSHYIPLSLDNMNTASFTPKKNYENNQLISGVLQLSRNTHLVLDETKMQEGKLDTLGLHNLKALSNAIRYQKVPYDFKFYSIEFECDLPVIVFSEGVSLLPHDIQIPLQPDPQCVHSFKEILDAAKHFLNPEMLLNIRRYLTQARLVEYQLSEGVQELVQEEFVRMRQDHSVKAEDLHNLLVLGRLLSLSEGRDSLGEDTFQKARDMEKERKSRLVN